MKQWMSILVRFGGLAFFGLALFGVLLFAEGYQYDSGAKQLVKKGIVYFEGRPQDSVLTVDGEPREWSIGGEVRVPPGLHRFTIAKPEHRPWSKQILVPDQTVVKYPRIILLPDELPQEHIVSRGMWRPMEAADDHSVELNSAVRAVRYYDFAQQELTLHELPLSLDAAAIKAINKDSYIVLDRRGRLLALDFAAKTALTSGLYAKDFTVGRDEIVYVDPGGALRRAPFSLSAGSPFLELEEPVTALTSFETDGDLYAFLFDGEKAVVARTDGSILFIRKAEAVSLEGDEVLYADGSFLREYDMTSKQTVERGAGLFKPRILELVPESFHMFIVDQSGKLLWCDRDGENCLVLRSNVTLARYDSGAHALFIEDGVGLIRLELPGGSRLLREFGVQ